MGVTCFFHRGIKSAENRHAGYAINVRFLFIWAMFSGSEPKLHTLGPPQTGERTFSVHRTLRGEWMSTECLRGGVPGALLGLQRFGQFEGSPLRLAWRCAGPAPHQVGVWLKAGGGARIGTVSDFWSPSHPTGLGGSILGQTAHPAMTRDLCCYASPSAMTKRDNLTPRQDKHDVQTKRHQTSLPHTVVFERDALRVVTPTPSCPISGSGPSGWGWRGLSSGGSPARTPRQEGPGMCLVIQQSVIVCHSMSSCCCLAAALVAPVSSGGFPLKNEIWGHEP